MKERQKTKLCVSAAKTMTVQQWIIEYLFISLNLMKTCNSIENTITEFSEQYGACFIDLDCASEDEDNSIVLSFHDYVLDDDEPFLLLRIWHIDSDEDKIFVFDTFDERAEEPYTSISMYTHKEELQKAPNIPDRFFCQELQAAIGAICMALSQRMLLHEAM
jgi:hypothetical protein